MKLACVAVVFFLCVGCFTSEPVVRPAKDRWGTARGATYRATQSEWAGILEWREVFDSKGNRHRVAVITHVSGLNPRDQVSGTGVVVKRRPMPSAFYLVDQNLNMFTSVNVPEGPVRVRGIISTATSGGVVYDQGKPLNAYATNPTTSPGRSLYASRAAIRPLIMTRASGVISIPLND